MTIRPAATLVLARDGEQGVEVLLLQRTHQAVFMPGFYVFPGGAVDANDQPGVMPELPVSGPTEQEASRLLAVDQGGLSYMIAAIRESFEEAGILLARDGEGRHPIQDDGLFDDERRRLCAGEQSLHGICRERSLELDLGALVYVGHWVTPPGPPRRYDTRFFLAAAPPGQQASHDNQETIDHVWLRPEDALEEHRQGKRLLAPPTVMTLRQMLGAEHVQDLLKNLGADIPAAFPTEPWPARTDTKARTLYAGEPPYDEVRWLDPERRGDAYCDIKPGRLVRLSPTIERLTAGNGGMMTGPGTNTYLVGDDSGMAVIDPGPADDEHIERILSALGDRPLTHILVTHTHRDHSPGAALLKDRLGAPVLGQPAPGDATQDHQFQADQCLEHGGRVQVGSVSLRALHTPGHASNHLCFLHEGEQILFSGDHIMQGSTVVINPPDGDMKDYLESLTALLDEDLRMIAPGHGFLMGHPHAVVDYLTTHRLAREQKVIRAMEKTGPATLKALTPLAYDDVPGPMQALGARSLLAHLFKLEKEGRARCQDEQWELL